MSSEQEIAYSETLKQPLDILAAHPITAKDLMDISFEEREDLEISSVPIYTAQVLYPNNAKSYLAVVDYKLRALPLAAFLGQAQVDSEGPKGPNSLGGILGDFRLLQPTGDDLERLLRHQEAFGQDWIDCARNIPVLQDTLMQAELPRHLAEAYSYEQFKERLLGYLFVAGALEYADNPNAGRQFPIVRQIAEAIEKLPPYDIPHDQAAETYFANLELGYQHQLVMDFADGNTFILPDDKIERSLRQSVHGINLKYIGNQRVAIQLGSCYAAEAYQTRVDGIYHNSLGYVVDPKSVQEVNYVYPTIHIQEQDGKRSFNLDIMPPLIGEHFRSALGLDVPEGLDFKPERFNSLLGLSLMLYLFPNIGTDKTTWPDQKGYGPESTYKNIYGIKPENRMGAVQTLLLQVQNKNSLLQHDFVEKLISHAQTSK